MKEVITTFETWREVFSKEWSASSHTQPAHVWKADGNEMTLTSTCYLHTGDDFHWIAVTPTQAVIDALSKSLMFIGDDRLYWKVIVKDDHALIICKHNKIIGSRWVAKIKPWTIPSMSEIR